MRYASSKEHREFFKQNHFITFEDLLNSGEIATIQEEIGRFFMEREPFTSTYMDAHDMFRKSDVIKKVVLRTKLAELAAGLTKIAPIRIGYDQLFLSPPSPPDQQLPPAFTQNLTLSEATGIDGLACGLMLNLSSTSPSEELTTPSLEEELPSLSPFPSKQGSGIFFTPDIPLILSDLFNSPCQDFLLIVYTEKRALYRLEENDPHTHELKKLGYIYGEQLKNTTHPIIFTKP